MTNDTLDGNMSNIETEPVFATFGYRLGAYLLDAIIASIIIAPIVYFAGFGISFTSLALFSILGVLYRPVLETLYGATFGKMILKLKVVQKGGVAITAMQAVLRSSPFIIASLVSLWAQQDLFTFPGFEDIDSFVSYIEVAQEYQAEYGMFPVKGLISNVVSMLPLISALFLLGHARKQALHDQLAETYVIRTNAHEV